MRRLAVGMAFIGAMFGASIGIYLGLVAAWP